jgi:hypothetical protein
MIDNIRPENWENQKAELRIMFPILIETDFTFDYGKKEVMMMNLQDKLGMTRVELNKVLSGFNNSAN